jgi:hypothetical protein
MAELQPIILINPVLTIDGTDLKCFLSHVELTPDVTTVEIKTSCGVKDYPGSVKWSLKATLYHNNEVGGTNETLTAAVEGGVPVPFTVTPSSDLVSATNPEYTGDLVPQPFTPLSGDVGDASSVDLEWSIIGWGKTPTTNIVPGGAAAAASSSSPRTPSA